MVLLAKNNAFSKNNGESLFVQGLSIHYYFIK